ncbi:MAG: ABC transporter ATP-binding protein [Lentisphaeria bacterium]|nr:ABC transporter ATP-binding protein [Lentisphaeria bacterium]
MTTFPLEISNLSFAYPSGPEVLQGVTLSLAAGERIGLAGGNGSGKTTLLHCVVGLLRPSGGMIRAFGRECRSEPDFRALRRRVGLVFQDADDQLFCPTVLEDVAFGPKNLGQSAEEAASNARNTLDRLGLAGLENRVTYRLSGGEKRLVSLAAVLAMQPDVLLLDEPAAGLDEGSKQRVREILLGLPQAMVVISHETGFIDGLAQRVAVLRDGRILPENPSPGTPSPRGQSSLRAPKPCENGKWA